jgi:hypothetical protein
MAIMDGAEIWDVVERRPNFKLPAALLYLVYNVREERSRRRVRLASQHTRARACPRLPIRASLR